MEDYTNYEKPFNETIKYINENLNLLEKNKDFIGGLNKFEREEFELLEKEFKDKYEKFKDIKRFSIPIIGTISSGKSSFLNFLLGMNCLESGNDIVTKSVVIIRHNRNLQPNERYIYSVNIKERAQGYYDFEKDEETKSEKINEIIKERNDYIRNYDENKMPNKEDFFMILEANIPLFKGENAKFGDFYEFLDIPGLDEGKEDSKSIKSSNFFKEQILPKIFSSTLFSIFIFDAGKYMRDENQNLFKNYINKYFSNNYCNSFFVLNKIDLMDNEEKEKKIFENEYLIDKLNLNSKDLKEKTIHLQYLSCKNLTSETKKYDNFQSYLLYLLTQGNKDKEKINFVKFLKEKMVEDFKADLTKIEKDEPNAEQKEKIKKNIKELDKKNSNFSITLGIKDYFNYSKAFDGLIKTLDINEESKKQQKTKKYQELYDDFYQSFYNSFHHFLNIPNDKDITKRIKNIVNNIEQIINNNNKTKDKKYLDLLYKDLNDAAKLSIKQFQNLKELVGKLSKEGKGLETFENLKNEFELIEFFIKKDKKLRIPLFGGYSSGKSSLLNCIIGKKILPEGNKVTTRKIVVIRNNDENKFTISKTNFVKTNGEYYCFEEGDIIENIDTPEKIYEFLKKENEDKSNENMFFLVSAPILLFKKMKLSKEILNKIEFIDFPGIDATEQIISDIFNNLADLSDTFLFINDCNLIKNMDNIRNMKRIVDRIEGRRFNFDYNSCLFILNKVDEDNENINKEKTRKEIEDIVFEENKSNSIFDFFRKNKNPTISLSLFSCKYYLDYLEFYDEFKDFELFINANIQEIEQEEGDDVNWIEKLNEKMASKLDTKFEKYVESGKKINDGYLSKLKFCLKNKKISEEEIAKNTENLENIVNSYIIMENNLDQNTLYLDSKYNTLADELEKKFIIAKDMTEKQFEEKIKTFINTLQNIFRLLQQKAINKTVCDISRTKEIFDKAIKEIMVIYKESESLLESKINSTFGDSLIKKIDILINFGKEEDTKSSELMKKIEEFKNDYKSEIKILDIFIKHQLFTFHLKIEKQILAELKNFRIIITNEEQCILIEGLSYVWESMTVVNGSVVFLISGLLKLIANSIGKLVKLMKGKDGSSKELDALRKEIQVQWNTTKFKVQKIMAQSLKKAIDKLKMLYDTQMSEINEKKVQELYEEFISIIGNKYEREKKDDEKLKVYRIDYEENEFIYQGYHFNNLREGYGKMSFAGCRLYEGLWEKNKKEGFGRMIFGDGSKYEGEYKNDTQNGFGIFTWSDDNQYIGEFKEGHFEGIGIVIYENGNKYEGEYINGRRNGIGTLYYKDGRKYAGEWKDGKKEGQGSFYLNRNEKFVGTWYDNRYILDNYIDNNFYIKKKEFLDNKKIKIEFVDGDKYEGEYNPKTKTLHGKGNFYFNHGAIYKGNFENNVFAGKGDYCAADGSIISGIFKNGKLNGQGEVIRKDKNILKGEFKDGKKEGIFLYIDKSLNKTIKRLYENDILKAEEIEKKI